MQVKPKTFEIIVFQNKKKKIKEMVCLSEKERMEHKNSKKFKCQEEGTTTTKYRVTAKEWPP